MVARFSPAVTAAVTAMRCILQKNGQGATAKIENPWEPSLWATPHICPALQMTWDLTKYLNVKYRRLGVLVIVCFLFPPVAIHKIKYWLQQPPAQRVLTP